MESYFERVPLRFIAGDGDVERVKALLREQERAGVIEIISLDDDYAFVEFKCPKLLKIFAEMDQEFSDEFGTEPTDGRVH